MPIQKILIMLFLFGSAGLYSQDTPSEKFTLNPWDGLNGLRTSAGYLQNFEVEGAYVLTSYPKQDPGLGGLYGFRSIGIGLEYLRQGKKDILGAKLSYDFIFGIFGAQIGADFIMHQGDYQVRIAPKVGLSAFGFLSLYYGYNVNTIRNSSLQPANHILILQITWLDI